MLQYVDHLLASPNAAHHEMAQELMSELNTQDVSADADVLRDIDTKVPLPPPPRFHHSVHQTAHAVTVAKTATWSELQS
jgi:hypothetical protein